MKLEDLKLEEYLTFHSPGYIIEIYEDGKEQEFIFGNSETKPSIKECTSNTLYDIASLTKLYTATLIYMAYEEKKINLKDKIKSIDSRFTNLENVRVIDLLSHNQEIWTNGYLGNAKTKEEFYEILFSSKVKSAIPKYVDTHYIILSTILEKIYHQTFDKILKEKIFIKLNLTNTTIHPNSKFIASNNYEKKDDKIVTDTYPGQVHDTKARVAKRLGISTGHASIFTTGKELLIFLKSFLDGTLLSRKTIELMLQHQDINQMNYDTLKKAVSGTDINQMYEEAIQRKLEITILYTYNNMGTRYRNKIAPINDVPTKCSENTIAFSGFTGPSFIIDFHTKKIIIIMCNVLHNTKRNRSERKRITDALMETICNQIYQ